MQKPAKKTVLLSAALAVLSLGLIGGMSGLAQTIKTYKIAIAMPFSGSFGNLAERVRNGAQLAASESNIRLRSAGIRLEIVTFDDKNTVADALTVAKKLVADPNVIAVLGHRSSGVTIAASEIYEAAKLVQITLKSTNPQVTDRGLSTVNRICGRDDIQGTVAAEYVAKSLGIKSNILVIFAASTYGQGLNNSFQKETKAQGVTDLQAISVVSGQNLDQLMRQVKTNNPKLIYLPGLDKDVAPIVKRLRAEGIGATLVSSDGVDSPEFIEQAGVAAKGLYFTTVSGPIDQLPNAAQFVASYKRRFSQEPDSFAPLGYDSLVAFAKAIETVAKQGAIGREAMSKAVRQVSFEGITGPVAFDGKGDRQVSSYFVNIYDQTSYPGAAIKAITRSPEGQ
jgi:branched-chain amino acid transport system substrate-binding protein